jgi:large repetitive protein
MAGRLPRGLGINRTTGVVSGVTSELGTASFTVRVRDAAGNVLDVPSTIEVLSYTQPQITGELPMFFTVGDVVSADLDVDGGLPAYVWSAPVGRDRLPDGLTIDTSTGVVSGTVSSSSSYGSRFATIIVEDSLGSRALRRFQYSYQPALAIAPVVPFYQPVIGHNYSIQLQRSGGHAPFVWTLDSGTLPPGITLQSNGILSGLPTAAFTGSSTFRVTDASGASVTVGINWTVTNYQAMALNLGSLPLEFRARGLSNPTSGQVSVTGGAGPFQYQLLSGTTIGFLMDPQTGAVQLYSSTQSVITAFIRVRDSTGAEVTSAPIQIQAWATPTIATFFMSPGYTGDPTYFTDGPATYGNPVGGKAPFVFVIAGITGPGSWPIDVDSDGVFVFGSPPSTTGTYSITFRVTDSFADAPAFSERTISAQAFPGTSP